MSGFDAATWPIQTDRLRLRPATAEDAMAVLGFHSLPDVGRWITRWPREPEAFAEHWRAHLASSLVVEHEGGVIGDLMVRIGSPYAQVEAAAAAAGTEAELGWVLDPAYGGRGLATEAVAAAVGLCFGPLGLRRVVAACFSDNTASWRLMERIGMRRELHEVAAALHRERGWLDGYGYALLAEEWHSGR